MKIRRGILWTAMTLSLVACEFKGCSSSTEQGSLEPQVGVLCPAVDEIASSSAEGRDSSVVTLSVEDTIGVTDWHTVEVDDADSVSTSCVKESESSTKLSDEEYVTERAEIEVLKEETLSMESYSEPDELKVEQDSIVEPRVSEGAADSIDVVNDTLTVMLSVDQSSEQKVIDSVSADSLISEEVETYVTQSRGMIRREATKKLFIPKGQWMLGGQLNWKQWDNDNLSYLLLQDLNFAGHTFSGGPYLGYFFAKNMAAGARFSYSRSYLNVDEVGMSLGEGLSFSLSDFNYLQHGYRSTVFLRSYIPIGESKIFGLFGELQLNHTFSEWKCTLGRDDLLQGVYQNTHAVGIGLGGGMVVFLTDFAAAEVMLNVGGCDYKWGYQNIKEIDKKDNGSLNSSSADFRIDLFSIKFGLTFYL